MEATEPQSVKQWFTVQETADHYRVCPKSIRNWIEEGRIKATRFCRQWRVSREELERLDREGI